jgi:hypothetical protein
MPPQVRDRIHDLMATSLIRADLDQRVRLTRVNNTQVQAEVTAEWKLYNYGSENKLYTPKLSFHPSEKPHFLEVSCIASTKEAYALQEKDLQIRVERSNDAVSVEGKLIEVRPNKDLGAYRIRMKYTVLPDTPFHTMALGMPSIGVRLSVSAPPDISYRIVAMKTPTLVTMTDWETDQMMLGGEHLTITWSCIDSPAGTDGQQKP